MNEHWIVVAWVVGIYAGIFGIAIAVSFLP